MNGRHRAAGLVGLAALGAAGCVFVPPPVTGDGRPWGGCKGPVPPRFEERTVPPVVNPFERGGRFHDHRTSAEFSGERMTFRDSGCRFEAVRDRADASPPPASWRTPPEAVHAIYRVVGSEGDCGFRLSGSHRISVAALGRRWAPDRTSDEIRFGAAVEGSRDHNLRRR